MKLLKQLLNCVIIDCQRKNRVACLTKASIVQCCHDNHHQLHTTSKSQSEKSHLATNNEYSNQTQSIQFSPKKAVILSKLTRYDFEKAFVPDISEEKLKLYLDSRNSDYEHLIFKHNNHQRCVRVIEDSLRSRGIETKTVARFDLTPELIDWADVVFTAGGDGTFLLAASVVNNRSTPVVGVNTDPEGSIGYLCLPKTEYSGLNFKSALDRLLAGKFSWKWRQRIRITMSGRHADDDPVNLHDEQLDTHEDRFTEHKHEEVERTQRWEGIVREKTPRVLPVLALNEVFMGERLSSRVSYYEVSFDRQSSIKQKCSGITVSTGTGSSSWLFNINHICPQSVQHILKIAKDCAYPDLDVSDLRLCQTISDRFNKTLIFDSSQPKMAYAIRDPIHNAISNVPISRGFTTRIRLRSWMWDACLVVDGGASFRFNDGSVATLEIHEEDALRTVNFTKGWTLSRVDSTAFPAQ